MALINIALSALDEFIGMSSTPYANALAVRSLLDLIRGQRQGPDADKANVLLASDARWYAKLLELSRPQDASALGASSSWAFCTLLGATVRTAPHHLLAKHMAHWMDHLVQHLRAADLRTRLAAALCSTAIIVRACAVGADTRRDAISVGQRLVQPHLNVLTACATTPDRLAAVNSLAEVAVAAPSLIKTLGPKILSALFALFDAETPAEARLARAAGRCAGRVAAAVYGSASVNGVAQFVVSALGSLHGVFGAVFDGCEDPAVNASVTPLWRATVESCGFAELRAMSPAAVDTPLAAQSRVAALCEAVVAAVTSTFPIPQQHLQQVQQQKLAAGIVLPTEAVVDLIRRFTSVNMDTIVVNNNYNKQNISKKSKKKRSFIYVCVCMYVCICVYICGIYRNSGRHQQRLRSGSWGSCRSSTTSRTSCLRQLLYFTAVRYSRSWGQP